MQFTSTAREDVNRPGTQTVDGFDTVRPEDPEPWVDDFGGRYASISDVPDRYSAIFFPRPAYRAPQNPILADVRKYRAERLRMNNPKGWDHALRRFEHAVAANPWDATPEHIDHARLVLGRLTRLANIYKEV